MAESENPNEVEKPEISIDKKPPADEPRPKRRRKFKFDKAEIGNYIADLIEGDMNERDARIQRRMNRQAKIMGWQGVQNYPWAGASQVFLPIMQIANLKTRGVLENSLKSMRPMMSAKAKQQRNQGKEDSINSILDYQFHTENRGNTIIDNYVGNFVSDEAAFLYTQWVKETQTYHDVRLLPGLDPQQDIVVQLLQYLQTMYPDVLTTEMTDENGWEWEITYPDQEDAKKEKRATVCFWETDDAMMEAHIVVNMTTHNGPVIRVPNFEDVIFPARAANFQPPTAANPEGATYVALLTSVNLDTVRRRMRDHTYDQMNDDDWTALIGSTSTVGSGEQQELPKAQKDDIDGVSVDYQNLREDREQAVWYGRLDVNDDGLEEDVIVWMFLKSKVIAKVALLTEIYPGIPIRRPFSHESFIPITNRICGISQDELLESLQDTMQKLIDQHMNWGEITNTPMFFYRASSGMKNEPIYIEPGMGYPLDDPQADVFFPTWPTKDSAYAINTISLLQQFVERIQMFSDVSFGRVPAGKASALRTASTTQSLLQQGDLRSEQVLRRVFQAFSDVFAVMHRLNRRYLPDQKEIRIQGISEEGKDAYATINRDDLDADIDFEFKATLINTNKQTLAAALDSIMMMAFSPIALQAGMVDVNTMYALLRDKTKALDLDPDTYWKRPPQQVPGPSLLAEEVLSMILNNEIPKGKPLEADQEHLQKLMAFAETEQFGYFNPTQVQLLKQWMATIQQRLMQQQQLMQAMQQMQGGGSGGPGQPPGAVGDTGPASNPMINGNEKIDESIGAIN